MPLTNPGTKDCVLLSDRIMKRSRVLLKYEKEILLVFCLVVDLYDCEMWSVT
jgi:hypothetical protein